MLKVKVNAHLFGGHAHTIHVQVFLLINTHVGVFKYEYSFCYMYILATLVNPTSADFKVCMVTPSVV